MIDITRKQLEYHINKISHETTSIYVLVESCLWEKPFSVRQQKDIDWAIERLVEWDFKSCVDEDRCICSCAQCEKMNDRKSLDNKTSHTIN